MTIQHNLRDWLAGATQIDELQRARQELSESEANHANRKTKAHLYLAPAWLMSGVATANGFFLKAAEAGLNDFKGLLLACMSSLVAAVLIGGASAMLLELASEMEPDQ